MKENTMNSDDLKKAFLKTLATLKGTGLVIKESITEFQDMGCFLPSSPWVGDGLVESLKENKCPKRIIEAGAGVGPITVKIMDLMSKDDILVVNELNPKFMEKLKLRVKEHKRYEELKDQISYFTGPIQDLENPSEKFNFVVCSLPFTNFSKELTESIFNKLFDITEDDCIMTYYEFVLIRNLSKVVSPKERKERVTKMSDYLMSINNKDRRLKNKIVWKNVFPINVYTLKLSR